MEISTRSTDGNAMVMGLNGRLDAVTSHLFEREIVAFFSKDSKRLALDFGQLDYISSAGLRVLILGAKKSKESGGALVIFGLKSHIMEVFEISGFSSILTILPGETEALASLA